MKQQVVGRVWHDRTQSPCWVWSICLEHLDEDGEILGQDTIDSGYARSETEACRRINDNRPSELDGRMLKYEMNDSGELVGVL